MKFFDVSRHMMIGNEKQVIICSDSIWKLLSNQDVLDIATDDPHETAS